MGHTEERSKIFDEVQEILRAQSGGQWDSLQTLNDKVELMESALLDMSVRVVLYEMLISLTLHSRNPL